MYTAVIRCIYIGRPLLIRQYMYIHVGRISISHLYLVQISDYHFLPDTAKAAERLRACLQETEDVPRDFTSLFDHSLYSLDTSVLPEAIK